MKKTKKKKIIWITGVAVLALLIYFIAFRKKAPEIVLATERPHYGYIANTITATGTVQEVIGNFWSLGGGIVIR